MRARMLCKGRGLGAEIACCQHSIGPSPARSATASPQQWMSRTLSSLLASSQPPCRAQAPVGVCVAAIWRACRTRRLPHVLLSLFMQPSQLTLAVEKRLQLCVFLFGPLPPFEALAGLFGGQNGPRVRSWPVGGKRLPGALLPPSLPLLCCCHHTPAVRVARSRACIAKVPQRITLAGALWPPPPPPPAPRWPRTPP